MMGDMSYAGRHLARWRTVPSLTGARSLDIYVIRVPYPTNVRLCPTDPHGGTPAGCHLPRWRTAHLTCKVIPILTEAWPENGGEGERPRTVPGTTGNARGFCPPFLGGRNFAPSFFLFWARGNCTQTPPNGVITTFNTAYYRFICYC